MIYTLNILQFVMSVISQQNWKLKQFRPPFIQSFKLIITLNIDSKINKLPIFIALGICAVPHPLPLPLPLPRTLVWGRRLQKSQQDFLLDSITIKSEFLRNCQEQSGKMLLFMQNTRWRIVLPPSPWSESHYLFRFFWQLHSEEFIRINYSNIMFIYRLVAFTLCLFS